METTPQNALDALDTWEYFCDEAYYHLWAVRSVGDRSFQSQYLFHVQSMAEAQALCGLLNDRTALKQSSAEVVTVDELGFEIEDMLADISFTNDRQRHFADALADRFGERFPSGLKIIRSEK